MEKLKNFCALPFTQFTVSSFNEYQLCCDNLGDSEMFSDKHSILEYFNSDYINEKRLAFLKNKRLDICKACWVREDNGLNSRRQESLKSNYRDQVKRYKEGLPLIPNSPVFKIKFGNLCNLRCIMCGPQSSSAWAQHKSKYDEGSFPIFENTFNDKTYEDLKIILPNVRRIIVSGGEPLMNDRYYDFLEWLIGHKFSKNLKVYTLTNATKIPDHLFQYKNAFKGLYFNISVDGIGERDEYIRTGTVWKKKVENIYRLQNNFNIGFEVTIQTLNIGYIEETKNFLNKKFKINPPLTNILVTPNYFDINNLPANLKLKYLKQKLPEKLKNILLTPTKNKVFKKGINFLKLCDKRNGTDFLKLWPEFKDYV
tara:strand:+ start:129 stop:1232 length:1104 start_codon:yes stop_codon:yes gene_type:complete